MANKPGEANFLPDVPVYPEMGTFQPVYGKFDLTTYIQGASDYEIMAFLVGKYNACLEAYGTVTKLSTDTITAAHQLQDWINNWFDNLDVQEELNNKIDSMVHDGSFGTILHQTFDTQINQQTTNAVTAWLVANVTPTGSAVVVDKSLSIEGAAADAKATGDADSQLKEYIFNCTDYYNQIESPISYGFNSFVKVEWEQGSLYNGNNLSRDYAVRTKEKQKYGNSIIKLTKTLDSDKYRLFYAEYDDTGVYIKNSTYYYGSSNYLDLNPNHYYRFVITTKDDTNLSPSDVLGKMHFVYPDNIYTDNSYSTDASIINALNRTVGSFDGGCVVFTCDDGQLQDYEYLYPIIREFNVPFVFGMWSTCPMITSKLNDVKDMIENYGCEVAQHGIVSWTDYTDYLNLYNSLKNEKQIFSDNGIIVKNAIYPYNDYNDVVKKACSGLYEYACCGGYHVNSWRNPALEVQRIWLVKNVDYQSDIDYAVSNNRLLVFGIHSKEMESDSEVITTVRNAIQYAKTKQIPIKTLNTLNTYY